MRISRRAKLSLRTIAILYLRPSLKDLALGPGPAALPPSGIDRGTALLHFEQISEAAIANGRVGAWAQDPLDADTLLRFDAPRLDPAACAGMALGAPHVTVSALVELHRLLIERGFRRSSLDDETIVQEEQNEASACTSAAVYGPGPAHYAVRFGNASGDEPLGSQHSDRPAGQRAVGGGRRRSRRSRR